MNRAEIKEKAKKMIKGNKWYIWKPMLIFGLAFLLINGVAFGIDVLLKTTSELTIGESKIMYGGTIYNLVSFFTNIVSVAFDVAYAMYILSFIRGKKLEMKDIIDFMKKNWVKAFVVSLVVGLIIFGCTILLIIPGIIAAIGLTFYKEVCADNPEMYFKDIIKKAWQMTKGHKMELFIFMLSFIGWEMLASLTLGILYIWLYPYIVVSTTLVYEHLKKTD